MFKHNFKFIMNMSKEIEKLISERVSAIKKKTLKKQRCVSAAISFFMMW